MTTASVFTGIKLGNESRTKLLNLARRHLGLLFSPVKGTHLVLKFRGNPNKIPTELMGKVVDLKLVGFREENGVQVALIEADPLKERLEWGSLPYILIATRPGEEFVAARAKALTRREAGDGDIEFPSPIILRGEIGFVHDRIGWVFSHLPDDDMVPTSRS